MRGPVEAVSLDDIIVRVLTLGPNLKGPHRPTVGQAVKEWEILDASNLLNRWGISYIRRGEIVKRKKSASAKDPEVSQRRIHTKQPPHTGKVPQDQQGLVA